MNTNQARLVLTGAVAAILVIALVEDRYYPVRVLSGEDSVGTWVSSLLLASCTTLSLVIAMKRGYLPWLPFMLFFLLLALDERFMFHENLKQSILFASHPPRPATSLQGELPVIAASFLGAVVAVLLWKNVQRRNRTFLVLATAFGSVSVLLDVLHYQMVMEDLSKVLGELCIANCLLGEI